jgi:hypothetical protein
LDQNTYSEVTNSSIRGNFIDFLAENKNAFVEGSPGQHFVRVFTDDGVGGVYTGRVVRRYTNGTYRVVYSDTDVQILSEEDGERGLVDSDCVPQNVKDAIERVNPYGREPLPEGTPIAELKALDCIV